MDHPEHDHIFGSEGTSVDDSTVSPTESRLLRHVEGMTTSVQETRMEHSAAADPSVGKRLTEMRILAPLVDGMKGKNGGDPNPTQTADEFSALLEKQLTEETGSGDASAA
jgi:hypothetical protein